MRRTVLLALTIALMLPVSGCIGGPAGTATEPTESRNIHPGYGEFNAGNVLIGDGEVMMDHYGLVIPVNRTAILKGIIFAREYRVSSGNGSDTTGYYGGKVELKAYLADIFVQYAWKALESGLKPVSELEVEITPETVEVKPGKNEAFEVKIDTSEVTLGKTYYLYIVAFGGDGWKGWAVVEVITEETTVTKETEND
ncbi:hypothetical protein [Thermococcus pacificus]|uniref:Uncharacterized protein n=1 Tax=Thermococcus pacificus TaxID=71998 RepID=A0A218P5I7_9EURY|nr:hypothetical protein [Thermococcus pacificus]ASJ06039.1 hypothetical protein A3L08_01180 [Thermococcus pacificus]